MPKVKPKPALWHSFSPWQFNMAGNGEKQLHGHIGVVFKTLQNPIDDFARLCYLHLSDIRDYHK